MTKDWFIARTRTRDEPRAVQGLRAAGIEAWVPMERHTVRHARKTSISECAVIPGYVFFRLEPEQSFYHVSQVREVRDVLGANRPQALPWTVFAELKASEEQGMFDYTGPPERPSFKNNDPVVIIGGPFAGQLAKIMSVKDKGARARVFLEAIGRFKGFPVNVPTSQLGKREAKAA